MLPSSVAWRLVICRKPGDRPARNTTVAIATGFGDGGDAEFMVMQQLFGMSEADALQFLLQGIKSSPMEQPVEVPCTQADLACKTFNTDVT